MHRDLKPANILVTMIDGNAIPKVIDFGVAKATGGRLTENSLETQFGAKELAKALATFRQVSGEDDSEALNTANHLALAYRSADRLDEAVALLTDTLQRSKATRGIDDIETLGCMNNLAITYKTAGRMDEAVAMLEDAVQRMQKHPPRNVARLSWIPIVMNSTYELAGQHDKAEKQLKAGYTEMKSREASIPTDSMVRLSEAADRLVRFYQ